MVSSAVQQVLDRLPDVRKSGQQWKAKCPAHEDRQPSLSIAQGEDGRALLKCHAGCSTEEIVQEIGLSMRDLMSDSNSTKPATRKKQASVTQGYKSRHQALAALSQKFGTYTACWEYHDAQNQIVGAIVRWDRPEGKIIRPISLDESGWKIGGMPVLRPLYRLPELLALPRGSRVYVCEGEKAVDAAHAVGLHATTSPHGSKSASQADWSALAGHDVVILPDADDAGERYAKDVSICLGRLNPSPTVRVVQLPDLPTGGDMADFIALRGGDVDAIMDEIQTLVDKTPVQQSLPIVTSVSTKPSMPRIEPFRSFPVGVLPESMSNFVNVGAKSIGCDASYIALPLLVGMASAIGNTRRIQLKRGWTEPSILWGAAIGESGSTKSPALELALRAVREKQEQQMRQFDGIQTQWKRDQELYDVQKTVWKRQAGRNPQAAGDPPDEPDAPTCARCWTDDTTMEALAKLLQENPRGLLCVRDELSGWLHFDRYSANGRGGESAKWLEMHGGRSLMVDRKTTGSNYVPQAAVSLVGGIQPGILARYVGQEHRENGLLARLLLTMPPRRAKRWSDADIDPDVAAEVTRIYDNLYNLQPASDGAGDPKPGIITLSSKGKKSWIDFYNDHNAEQAELTGDLAAAWSKLEGYAARFALVLHMVRSVMGDGVGNAIDARTIDAAVTLSRWFANEARRVYAMLGEDDQSREDRQNLELIERMGGSVKVREWQRKRSYDTAKEARAELNVFVENGLGRWEEPVSTSKVGRPPSEMFILNQASDDDWGEL